MCLATKYSELKVMVRLEFCSLKSFLKVPWGMGHGHCIAGGSEALLLTNGKKDHDI